MATDSIIQKIKKLIDLSKSTDSLKESESFMLGAQQLLLKYNLEMQDIETHESEGIDGSKIIEMIFPYTEEWEMQLAGVIGFNNFCHVINDPWSTPKSFSLIGKPSNVNSVVYMNNFYKNKIQQLSINSYSDFLDIRKLELYKLNINFDKLKK